MGKVMVELSISLDGFIACPNDEVGPRFDGYSSGDTDLYLSGTDMTFKVSSASAELLRESWGTIGTGVAGRRTFIAQQCLSAGLLDEIHIDPAPVLLGEGIRMFDQLGTEPIRLEIVRVIEGKGVKHLQLHVLKSQKGETA